MVAFDPSLIEEQDISITDRMKKYNKTPLLRDKTPTILKAIMELKEARPISTKLVEQTRILLK